MTSVRPLRAIVYVRLSRHRGEEDPTTSPARQEAACRSYIEAQGWELVDVVQDLDVSGSEKRLRLDRPGLREIRSRWAEIDVVLFMKLDRLARNVVDFAAFAEEARKHGVDLVSVRDGLDLTTSGGRFVATILAAFGQMEAETIAERTRDGLRAVRDSGRWTGGPAPYGFRVVANPDGPGKVLEIEPEEAAFVREAAERVLAGANLSAVVRWANGPDGRAPRRAEEWTRRTMAQVLTGAPASGRIVKIERTGEDGRKVRKAVPVLGPDGRPLRIPAILSDDEAAALRAKLAPTPDARKGGRQPARLLSGLLRCSGCGERMQVARRVRVGDREVPVTYRCQTAREAGRCQRPVSISAPMIEEHLVKSFLAMHGDRPYLIRRAVVTGAAEVEEAEEAKAVALAALASEPTSEGFAALQAAQARLEAALAAPQETEVRLVPTGRTVAEEWDATDVHGRRDLLAANLAAIMVKPGRRGPRGLDASRLDVIWSAPFAGEALSAEEYATPGLVVV